jgi:AcrR family transcriptional regulator
MPKPLPDHVLDATGGDPDAVRAHLLDAAHRVVVERGLAGASTRHIAAEAGVAGGTLYNYFDDRLDLVATAILRRAHVVARPVGQLASRAGTRTVEANLRWFARHADTVLAELVPLFAAAFGEPALLARIRERMADGDPSHVATDAVVTYLRAEQELGRLRDDVDVGAAAAAIVSICHDRAFQRFLHGEGPRRGGGSGPAISLVVDAITT